MHILIIGFSFEDCKFAIPCKKGYNGRMRRYQRKTLVREEKWVLIDEWYWCPQGVVDARIEEHISKADNIKKITRKQYLKSGNPQWIIRQHYIETRIAHACDDGEIRAPRVEVYKRGDGFTSIYGKCRHCSKHLSDEIKAIAILECVV